MLDVKMGLFEKLLILIILIIVLNFPFGSYRLLTRKFSVAWWLSIHLPIPLIIVLRSQVFDLPLWVIPITFTSAIIGQIIGGRYPHCGQGVRVYLNKAIPSR